MRALTHDEREANVTDRLRVLLADDSELLVKRVAEHLASSCDVVGMAHDGQDLVEAAFRLAPDVIVADISMPILTGIEAAYQLREDGLAARLEAQTNHRARRKRAQHADFRL